MRLRSFSHISAMIVLRPCTTAFIPSAAIAGPGVSLDAAETAAAAPRPVQVDADVAQFPRRAVDSEVQFAVDDQPAAYPSAERVTRGVGAAARAELPFAERHRARVVEYGDGQPGQLRQL